MIILTTYKLILKFWIPQKQKHCQKLTEKLNFQHDFKIFITIKNKNIILQRQILTH